MQYRRDPVPNTGCSNQKWSSFYKYPKTIQEKSQSFAYPDLVRAKRRARNLPNAWKDVPRTDAGDHCWKRNKKRLKQWMKL